MTLAALFTLGNFVQLAAFLGLAYVLQQSYKAQPVAPGGGPWSRPGGAPSSGVGGQRYPQPISNLIESERRQHGTKRSPAEVRQQRAMSSARSIIMPGDPGCSNVAASAQSQLT